MTVATHLRRPSGAGAPLIGITGRRLSAGTVSSIDPRFAGVHFDSFFSDFARAVAAAGGIPVHLPFEAGTADTVGRLDGLIITGGQDIHPVHWGGDVRTVGADDPRIVPSAIDRERDAYELVLVRAALDKGVPLLGVCRGHQMINVVLGGDLVADLPQSPIEHNSKRPPPRSDDHDVCLVPGSLAHRLYGERVRVNSWHHQAVNTLGGDLLATGHSDDGVIESIELPGRAVFGVQWHAEWHPTPDPAFGWIVDAATDRQRASPGIGAVTIPAGGAAPGVEVGPRGPRASPTSRASAPIGSAMGAEFPQE